MAERDTIQIGSISCVDYGGTWRLHDQDRGDWAVYEGELPATDRALRQVASWSSRATAYRELALRGLTGSGRDGRTVSYYLSTDVVERVDELASSHGSKSAVVEAAVREYRCDTD